MRSNFLNFAKMQVSALSQIVWIQLLCLVLYPLFFSQLNAGNDLANVITYAAGLLMFSYLLIRNFAFNDAKYRTKLLFSILPVTPRTIVGARGTIVYIFCLIATSLLVLFSNIIHVVKPQTFAAVAIHILPYGFLFVAVFLPIEFLIFYLFETQKADIIAALAIFPYMGLMFLMYSQWFSNMWRFFRKFISSKSFQKQKISLYYSGFHLCGVDCKSNINTGNTIS